MADNNEILNRIADQIDLTDTQFENATRTYEAVGELLNENQDIQRFGGVKIFPQGSVALGTVVKPIESDDYDVDMVCLFYKNSDMTADQIKQTVGNVLKSSTRYSAKLEKEGKRCWTLNFNDYHMDILPAKKNKNPIIYEDVESITITHKETPYSLIETRDTNPKGYLKWFLDQCNKVLQESKKSFSIEDPKQYPKKTVLQKTVQLLKRHRDVYAGTSAYGKENAPISIIITTLAAQAYSNETTLIDSLINVSSKMEAFIKKDSVGNYRIPSPVDPRENFADKWNSNPVKAAAFYAWVSQLKKDLQVLKVQDSGTAEFLKKIFGNKSVCRVFDSIAEETRVLRENGKLKMDAKGALGTAVGVAIASHKFYGEK